MTDHDMTPEAMEAARRQLMHDMAAHVREMLDRALPQHPPAEVLNMAVLIFELSDPMVHRLVTLHVMPLPAPAPGQPNVGAAIVRRHLIPILAAATTPEGQPVFDCTPILAAQFIPIACMAFGGLTVAQQMPKPGLA